MPDDSYWFGGPRGEKVSMYVPPGTVVPVQLDLLDAERRPITYRLLSAPLWCDGCNSRECHTQRLGECLCGTHQPTPPTPPTATRPGSPGRAAVVLTPARPDPSRPPTATVQPARPRFDTR